MRTAFSKLASGCLVVLALGVCLLFIGRPDPELSLSSNQLSPEAVANHSLSELTHDTDCSGQILACYRNCVKGCVSNCVNVINSSRTTCFNSPYPPVSVWMECFNELQQCLWVNNGEESDCIAQYHVCLATNTDLPGGEDEDLLPDWPFDCIDDTIDKYLECVDNIKQCRHDCATSCVIDTIDECFDVPLPFESLPNVPGYLDATLELELTQ